MSLSAISGLITPAEYQAATALWQEVISTSATTPLQQSFAVDSNILQQVAFPISQITSLVSTVGMVQVKAKFGLFNTGSQLRFTVILFATDINDARISSYYISTESGIILDDTLPNGLTPNFLAQTWIDNWDGLGSVTPDLFVTSYGPLQGYTFQADDFIRPFFDLKDPDGMHLYVRFGLHQYYRPGTNADTQARTFGLVLQLQSQDELVDPFFDLSMPCPPTC